MQHCCGCKSCIPQLACLCQWLEIEMQPQKTRNHLINEREAASRLRHFMEATAIRELIAGSLIGIGMVIGIAATFW